MAPVSSEDDTADSERMVELERRREAVLKLQSVNSDITGWVQLDGTDINFPVLTPPADDPQYYLYRNYKKESTKYGQHLFGTVCARWTPIIRFCTGTACRTAECSGR